MDSSKSLKKFHNASRTRMVPSIVKMALYIHSGSNNVPTTLPTALLQVAESVKEENIELILVTRSVSIVLSAKEYKPLYIDEATVHTFSDRGMAAIVHAPKIMLRAIIVCGRTIWSSPVMGDTRFFISSVTAKRNAIAKPKKVINEAILVTI